MKVKKSSGERVLPSEGVHEAQLLKIIDLGTQYSEKYDSSARKVILTFELDEKHVFNEENGEQPFLIDARFTLKLTARSNFGKFVASWLGKKFADLEDDLDLNDLFQVPCQLNLVYNKDGDNTYCNIDSVMPVPKSVKYSPTENDTLVFDLDDFDADTFESLPDWLQETIGESPEYKEISKPKTSKTKNVADVL